MKQTSALDKGKPKCLSKCSGLPSSPRHLEFFGVNLTTAIGVEQIEGLQSISLGVTALFRVSFPCSPMVYDGLQRSEWSTQRLRVKKWNVRTSHVLIAMWFVVHGSRSPRLPRHGTRWLTTRWLVAMDRF